MIQCFSRLIFIVQLCFDDFENMFLQVLCATVEDEPRFRDLIGQWIAEGSVPEFPQHLWVRMRQEAESEEEVPGGGEGG